MGNILIGILLLLVGYALTVLFKGQVIFIGAMVVGVISIVLGLWSMITR